MKPKKLIPYLVLPTLFISALGFQTHLNLKPQIIIALFTSLTIGSFLFKKEKIATLLFATVVAFCSFLFWDMMLNNFVHSLYPVDNMSKEFVEDKKWLIVLPFSIILSAASTWFYFKKLKRDIELENYNLIAYLLMSVVIIVVV